MVDFDQALSIIQNAQISSVSSVVSAHYLRNVLFYIISVNGGLTGWTAWTVCTKTCDTNTVSIRERYCTNPPPQGRGKDCVGQKMQARACASWKCPGKDFSEVGNINCRP